MATDQSIEVDVPTLRDLFATFAPPYPFALPEIGIADAEDPGVKLAQAIARWRYEFADAMLKERAK